LCEVIKSLIANGRELDTASSESGSGLFGRKFRISFDALPTDLKKLEIELASNTVDYEVKENIKLYKNLKDQAVIIKEQKIQLNRVYEENNETCVTFTTEKGVMLSKVYLNIDGKKIELENTVTVKGNTRTMFFKGVGNKPELDIKKIRVNKETKKVIDIPIK